MNYYNEHDPKAAAWLRELIKGGHIANGIVDERSILDVRASDLVGYTQCHFFAGIGGWSLALRLAGWPDDKPAGTGSCPCQPFSDAGKGLGEADERHLWPVFFRLIVACRALGQRWTDTIFGEQVASKAALVWLDGVCADLEGAGYAVGAADLCAASAGSPQIRQRLYWMANALCDRRDDEQGVCRIKEGSRLRWNQSLDDGDTVRLADSPSSSGAQQFGESGRESRWGPSSADAAECGALGRMDDTTSPRCSGTEPAPERDSRNEARLPVPCAGRRSCRLGNAVESGLEGHSGHEHDRHKPRWIVEDAPRPTSEAGPACFWSPSDLLPCTDGAQRRIEPGSFPLVDGLPGRVGLLRGYGNAICPQLASEFIQACQEALA